MVFWVKLEGSFRLLVAIGIWILVGTIGDVSVVVFNDVVSVVISGANSWEKQMVLMSVSLNGGAGCWSELLDLLLPLWSFSFCCWVLSISLVSLVVVLKTSIALCLNESRPLIDFLFIMTFCFIRSVMLSGNASLVILEAIVLERNQTLNRRLGVCGWCLSNNQ